MKDRDRRSLLVAARALCSAGLVASLVGLGCAGSKEAPPKTAAPAAPADAAAVARATEQTEQREAQGAWCRYLQALYVRAAAGATSWPRYEQCLGITTMASPKLLRRTADCSLAALKQFEGDPFTSEYASEVTRCGAEALDSMVVAHGEIAPFVAAICGRAASCGTVGYEECREGLEAVLGPQLERAIGAINQAGRTQFRSCLRTAACGEVATQITSCLEPIMDGLLWLPG